MKRLTYMLLLLFSVTALKGQDHFVGYEYWFDSDSQNKVEVDSVTGGDFELSVDVSHLVQGVHSFCFRAKDEQNRCNVPLTHYFLRAGLDDKDVSNIGCEYWLDTNCNDRKRVSGNNGVIDFEADVATLSQGVHFLNYRLANASGGLGVCHVQPFLRTMIDAENISAVGCEYWTDDNYADRKVAFGNEGIIHFEADVSTLSQGVHYLNYRLTGATGGTGVCHTYPFLRIELDETDVTELRCEYWLDNDFSERQSVPVGANGIVNMDAEIFDKTPGIHFWNYRLADARGSTGAIATHMFLHTHLGQTDPTQWNCEYWFDTNYADKQSVPVNADSIADFNADLETLSKGIHFLNYRFRDSDGHSSITSTQCFLRVASDSLDTGKFQYEYWFDRDYAHRREDICYGPLVEMNVNTSALPGGIHCFNFRIRDNDESYCPTVTQYFIHSGYRPEDNQLSQYCYWFDDGRPDTVNIEPVNPLEWTDKWIDVPELPLPEAVPADLKLTRYYPESIIEPEDADKVWLKLNMTQECMFHLRFKTNADIWTEDDPSRFDYENSRVLSAAPIAVNRVSRITKSADAGIQGHYIDATAGILCLRSDQPCRLTLFSEDGARLSTLEPEELLAGVQIEIPQTGRYYALSDGISNDDVTTDPQKQVKLVCVTDPLPDVVEVSEAGTLPDLLSFTPAGELKQLALSGSLNGTDIRQLRSLPALSKLNLGDAVITQGGEPYDENHRTADYTVGDRMFSGFGNLQELLLPVSTVALGEGALYGCTGLREITVPAGVKQVGRDALSGMGGNLLVVHWLASGASVTAEAFDTPEEMGNCLIYAPAGTEIAYEGNVVVGGSADAIRLTDEKPFRCPEAFKAKEITYVRHFDLPSGNNGQAGGWEGIVLPFDVMSFRSEERGELAPFDSGKEGVRPFWLAELTREEGFRLATELRANKPYIISMPNSDNYEEEFNIRGNVIFYAGSEAGVDVRTTGTALREEGQKFALVPAYEPVIQHDTVYVINRIPYAGQLAGGAFVRNLRDALPFEAYASSNAVLHAPVYYGIGGDIGGATGLEASLRIHDNGLKVYSRAGIVYIESDRSRELGIYGSDGRMLRLLRVGRGRTELHDLLPGVYFVGKKKVSVVKQ
ncbi:leucine-rich repeat domain-containing protein [Bacteroides salyersiae]|uniref:leucine-rich repeat domain-containing protein n=1 Tax=Bacteroides salyersiae TaxID=291644 RepID=UPI001C8B31AE|nr:leucine-rich repeat domain-containing protein [Bacteroides salyersiae]